MDVVGLLAVVAVLVVGVVVGLWRGRNDGRLRPVAAGKSPAGTTKASAGAASDPAGVLRDSAGAVRDLAAAASGPAAVARDSAGATGDSARTGPNAADARRVVTPDVEETPAVIAEPAHDRLDPDLLAALGVGAAQATLLQFSSAFCAPCRAVRRVSSEVAALLPGVQHVDVDAESHLGAVRALNIWRTPTLFVLDADGRVARRATGVPSKAQLIAALGELLPARDRAPGQR
jgi:thiol-disulfide isomerase/thioredoxin